MSIESSPNRVVRTVSSTIAFIGHNQAVNEDVLIECFVDSQTNAVSFVSSSKARYGKDYVEANESVQPLIDYANAPQAGENPVVEVDEEGNPITTAPLSHVLNPEVPPWKRLGYSSKEEWKAAGRPNTPKVS